MPVLVLLQLTRWPPPAPASPSQHQSQGDPRARGDRVCTRPPRHLPGLNTCPLIRTGPSPPKGGVQGVCAWRAARGRPGLSQKSSLTTRAQAHFPALTLVYSDLILIEPIEPNSFTPEAVPAPGHMESRSPFLQNCFQSGQDCPQSGQDCPLRAVLDPIWGNFKPSDSLSCRIVCRRAGRSCWEHV